MERKYKNIQTALDKLPRYDRKNGYYVEIFYDTEEDEVWGIAQYSLGFNSWTEYRRNPEIVKIGNFTHKVSKNELIEYIEEATRQAHYFQSLEIIL